MFIPERPRDLYFLATPVSLAPSRQRNTTASPRASAFPILPDRQNGVLGRIFGGPAKTTLRAGYGLFYTAFEGLSAGIMSANPPYGYDYTSLAPPLFATPFVSAASGQNVGQRFRLPFPDSALRRLILTQT